MPDLKKTKTYVYRKTSTEGSSDNNIKKYCYLIEQDIYKQLDAGTRTLTDAVNNTSICAYKCLICTHAVPDDQSVACSSHVLH